MKDRAGWFELISELNVPMANVLALDFTWVRPSSGGVGGVAVGVSRGLSELGTLHECLVYAEHYEEWVRALVDSPQATIHVVPSGMGSVSWRFAQKVRNVIPDQLRAGWAMTMVRRLRSEPTRSRIGLRTVWAPFHRVPLLASNGVVTVHDLRVFESGLESEVDQRTVARNVARAKAVVCSWPHPYRQVIDRFPTAAGKTFLVALPVLVQGRPPEVRRQIEGDLRLLYPAAVTPHKNHETLIRAMARIPSARLVCTGSEVGGYADEVRRLADSVGVSERVEWKGFIPDSELDIEYERAHVLVMPSRWEAASGPIFEAVARELPLVASDIEPLRAQLDELGLDVPTFAWNDADALASAIRKLAANYDEYVRATGEPGRRLRTRSWSDTASEYLEVFRWVEGSIPYPSGLAPQSI